MFSNIINNVIYCIPIFSCVTAIISVVISYKNAKQTKINAENSRINAENSRINADNSKRNIEISKRNMELNEESFKNSINEAKISRTPNLILYNQETFSTKKVTIKFVEDIIFNKRSVTICPCLLKKEYIGEEPVEELEGVFVMNFSECNINGRKVDETFKCSILTNFAKTILKNIGAPLIKCVVYKVLVGGYEHGETLELSCINSKGNNLAEINTYIRTDENLELYLSYLFKEDDDEKFMPFSDVPEQFVDQKTVGNIFGKKLSYIPDRFKWIEYYLETTNIYYETNKQKIIIKSENCAYYTWVEKVYD